MVAGAGAGGFTGLRLVTGRSFVLFADLGGSVATGALSGGVSETVGVASGVEGVGVATGAVSGEIAGEKGAETGVGGVGVDVPVKMATWSTYTTWWSIHSADKPCNGKVRSGE